MKLGKQIKLYTALENYFLESINSHRLQGEGMIVPVVEEHLFQIAMDKLADEKKWELRDELFYSLHDNFKIVDTVFERIYLHKKTGIETAVGPKEVIKYGNRYIWEDFLLTVNRHL
jgi:hypothetical protein